MKRIAALLMCLVLVCFTGCTNNDESFTQKSYTAEAEEITEVCIAVRDKQIEVMRSSDDQIHIEYFENSKDYYDISVSNGHTLTMADESDRNWMDYIGGKSPAKFRKILLKVPDTLLTALRLSTTNEDISVPALTVGGDLYLSSHGGNIVFDKLNIGNSIYLDSKNGDITGSIIGSYNDYAISCKIKKGESNLPSSKQYGTKTLTVSNNNGDIDIEFISV